MKKRHTSPQCSLYRVGTDVSLHPSLSKFPSQQLCGFNSYILFYNPETSSESFLTSFFNPKLADEINSSIILRLPFYKCEGSVMLNSSISKHTEMWNSNSHLNSGTQITQTGSFLRSIHIIYLFHQLRKENWTLIWAEVSH